MSFLGDLTGIIKKSQDKKSPTLDIKDKYDVISPGQDVELDLKLSEKVSGFNKNDVSTKGLEGVKLVMISDTHYKLKGTVSDGSEHVEVTVSGGYSDLAGNKGKSSAWSMDVTEKSVVVPLMGPPPGKPGGGESGAREAGASGRCGFCEWSRVRAGAFGEFGRGRAERDARGAGPE